MSAPIPIPTMFRSAIPASRRWRRSWSIARRPQSCPEARAAAARYQTATTWYDTPPHPYLFIYLFIPVVFIYKLIIVKC